MKVFVIKGTVNVISSDPSFIERHPRFTTYGTRLIFIRERKIYDNNLTSMFLDKYKIYRQDKYQIYRQDKYQKYRQDKYQIYRQDKYQIYR